MVFCLRLLRPARHPARPSWAAKAVRGDAPSPPFGAGTHVEEDGGRLICFAMQSGGSSPAAEISCLPSLKGRPL